MSFRPFFAAIGWLFLLSAFRSSETAPASLSKDPRLLASVWFAMSAENQACYLQTYRLASMQLGAVLKEAAKSKRRKAIVTDLDETVLDNSGWTIRVLMENKDYPEYWQAWEKAGKAPAFPGAVDFFKKVANKGIAVYYISNRLHENLGATIRNLKDLGLPYADSAHVFLKTTESNKVARRAKVLEKQDIIMLLGDNLADFDGVWEKAPTEDRLPAVTNHTADWGRKFFIFPNPVYGSWKDALFSYRHKFSESQTDSVWRKALTDYEIKNRF